MSRDNKKLLLVMDGYACQITFKTLSILCENGIVVVGIPAHTSHVLQPLDVGVFGRLKEKFRQLLVHRSITTSKKTRITFLQYVNYCVTHITVV